MSVQPDNPEAAARTLEQLHREADAVRAELARLRLALAQVQSEFHAAPATAMRGVNEQLVLAAVHSQEIADAAHTSLRQLPRLETAAAAPTRRGGLLRHLRDANEQLVLSAVRFQELEGTASAAHRRQIAFLATVAHELRNPLMPLRLAAELLGRAEGDAALAARLRATITGQVAHIARLVGDLLDGARVSTGKFRLDRSVVDLTRILGLAVETCMPAVQARGHAFDSRITPEPLLVDGDPVRLVQIFANLLENAAKYTPEGGRLLLNATRVDSSVEVTVSDNGVGISAEALPHIFELFVQEARATELAREGLGIGLAVVGELVEAHGGTVRAYSGGQDQGSRFVVSLPLVAPD